MFVHVCMYMCVCILCASVTPCTTVNSPVPWNLYNEDTIGTTVNSPVQLNLYTKDTIGIFIVNFFKTKLGIVYVFAGMYMDTDVKTIFHVTTIILFALLACITVYTYL